MFKSISRIQTCVGLRTLPLSHLRCIQNPANKDHVHDLETFFTKIGRKAVEYKDSFESFDEFLKADSYTLKSKGIDTRLRRYMINWRYKFLNGESLKQFKQPPKSFGGERKRKEVLAKLAAEKRNARENR